MSFFVPQFFRETYTRERYDIGFYVNGKWQAGALANTTNDYKGSIQPVRDRELQYLPEGRRNKEAIVIYTAANLNTLDEGAKMPPDIVVTRGKRYEVARTWHHTTPWNHVKAICFLIDGV